MQAQAKVYQFDAEPQVSHPKYRDQDIYEELTDLPDNESRIKPDYYIDRPITPEYKPLPKGIDEQTQIEEYEPDLFDYKLEVEPVLQVLIGKSLEQARMELIEESERQELLIQKAAFLKKRNAELIVTQRMETAYVRKKDERERRILQHKKYQDQMKLSQQKFIARTLSKNVIKGINYRILNDLQNLGLLRNDHLLELKVQTLPWLIERIKQNCDQIQNSQMRLNSFLEDIQNPLIQHHQIYYQKEQLKRQKHLDQLEKKKIEIEERKKRKIEIRRRRALKEKRDIQKQAIYNLTISKAELSNSIFQVNIQEGISEIGQKGVVLHMDLFLLLAEVLDLITGDQIHQIDEYIIQTIWIDILINKCSSFNISLNSVMQPIIQEALNKIDEDLFIFEKNAKQLTIEFLRTQSPFWSSYVSQQFSNNIRKAILNKLLDGFFEIYFKSVNYKETKQKTEPQNQTDEPEQQINPQQPTQTDDNSESQLLDQQINQQQHKKDDQNIPEITQHDLDMVEAKKKINLIFKQPQTKFENISAIVNLLIPHLIDEQQQDQNQEQQTQDFENQQEIPQQIEEPVKSIGKWDFDPKIIDIYDGEQPLIQEGVRESIDSIFQYSFQDQVIVNDERAIEFARMQIYDFLKEKLESFMSVPDFSSLQFKKLKHTYPNIPIFDFLL
ncbi:unnamed protein product [Paramecium sonneborni]|uniref:Uncharacterized protein n=1 Tax=Paramecium sonneborni TaxID=65129 RepID=A0A8S1Q3T7_9CILI|nr:unnamed protein product [Paramecium sonneborni]